MIKPCYICKGACCETITFDEKRLNESTITWLLLRGELREGVIELPCKCKHLLEGKCSIYPMRPDICKAFEVGGESCINSIKRRRTLKQQEEIFDAITEIR